MKFFEPSRWSWFLGLGLLGILFLMLPGMAAAHPSQWEPFQVYSPNLRYVAKVHQILDPFPDPWQSSHWRLEVFRIREDGSHEKAWGTRVTHPGEKRGVLSNDGRSLVLFQSTFRPTRPVIWLYRQGKFVKTLTGTDLRIEVSGNEPGSKNGKLLPGTVWYDRSCWGKGATSWMSLKDPNPKKSRYSFLRFFSKDQRLRVLNLQTGHLRLATQVCEIRNPQYRDPEWFRETRRELQSKAAAGDVKAMTELSRIYVFHDANSPKMRAQLKGLLTPAAEAGVPEAQALLGRLYRRGWDPLEQDPSRALSWYRRAADQGHRGSMFFLGEMHLRGEGTPRDAKQALKWFQKGAELGHAESRLQLARCYEQGIGTARNPIQAYVWYSLAFASGPPLEALDRIQNRETLWLEMDSGERAQAEGALRKSMKESSHGK